MPDSTPRRLLLKIGYPTPGKLYVENDSRLLLAVTDRYSYSEEHSRLFFEDIASLSVTRRVDWQSFLAMLLALSLPAIILLFMILEGASPTAILLCASINALILGLGIYFGAFRQVSIFTFVSRHGSRIEARKNMPMTKRRAFVSAVVSEIRRFQAPLHATAPLSTPPPQPAPPEPDPSSPEPYPVTPPPDEFLPPPPSSTF